MTVNIDKVKKQLIVDEAKVLKVYLDSLEILTCGIGHKVLVEDHLKLGDIITEEQCNNFFKNDFDEAVNDVTKYIKNFVNYPEEVQEVIINMTFNLGITGILRFKKFLAALDIKDYKTAADEMKNSDWYGQVGDRAKRLIARIKALQ
jgi:lysozyme